METPVVSVIVPTYKRCETLSRAVKSALNQTYANIEVIVVDDNDPTSSYRSAVEQVMLEFQHDDRVVYIPNVKNCGGAVSRNVGIRESSGAYISFLDDDDSFHQEKVEKQLDFLLNNKIYKAVYCGSYIDGEEVLPTLQGDLTRELLLMETLMDTSTLMMTTSVVSELNGFDEDFIRHQDYEFLLRYFRLGEIGVIPRALVKIGRNDGANVLHGQDLENMKSFFLSKFESYITDLDELYPGSSQKIYARHYATTCFNHFSHGYTELGISSLKKNCVTYRGTFICELIYYLSKKIRIKFQRLLKRRG